jgi:hypothetical protein
VASHKTFWCNIVGIIEAVAMAVVTHGTSLAHTVAVYAADAAIEGFAGTLANGGGLGDALVSGLKGGALAGASAFATVKIGDVFQGVRFAAGGKAAVTVAKAAAHGVTEGALTKLGGGKFVHGFASAAFTDAVGDLLAGGPLAQSGSKDSIWDNVASAVVGGTASKLAGGNFVNGAVTGAMVYALNTLNHLKKPEPELKQGREAQMNEGGAKKEGGIVDSVRKLSAHGESGSDVLQAGATQIKVPHSRMKSVQTGGRVFKWLGLGIDVYNQDFYALAVTGAVTVVGYGAVALGAPPLGVVIVGFVAADYFNGLPAW